MMHVADHPDDLPPEAISVGPLEVDPAPDGIILGKKSRASRSLTMTTGTESAVSPLLKSRPSIKGMPIVRKYPGEADQLSAWGSGSPSSVSTPSISKLPELFSPLSGNADTAAADSTPG